MKNSKNQLIVKGLPDCDEVELHDFIASRASRDRDLSSCTIIRHRETKRSRGFGFLTFHDDDAAHRFYDTWHNRRDDDLVLFGNKLWVDYARNEEESWICDYVDCKASNYAHRKACYKCQRTRETDWTKDTGHLPTQFLQVRDLPPDTTPQQIVTALVKLDGVQLRRLLLLEGREAEDVPVAFVELRDANAAGRVLALAAALPGKGFSINRKQVSLSFIHPGVFVPVYGGTGPGVFKATNSPQLLAYWNPNYLCSTYIPENAITEDDVVSTEKTLTEGNSEKKRKAPNSNVTIKSGSGGMIGHWSKRQDELNGLTSSPAPSGKTPPTSFADLRIMACLLCSRKFKSEADIVAHESSSDLHRDNLANPALLQKAQARLAARAPPLATVESSDKTGTGESIEYRDRAWERRQQLKAAGEIIEMPTSKKRRRSPNSHSSSHLQNQDDQDEQDEQAGQKGESKGSKLLGKMGYVPGSGLGLNGQGRAEPVSADTYLPGVGLGVTGAKLTEAEAQARRGTGGPGGTYREFVESVKEHARARFEREF